MELAPPLMHWHQIKVYKSDVPHGEVKESLFWNGLSMEQMNKWRWYFIYRAALLQVKYPRLRVEHQWGSSPAEGKSLINALISRRSFYAGRITMWSRKIREAEQEWNELFPIQEHALYQKAIAKLQATREELKRIENELEKLNYFGCK